tara:strand:+ start:193 stop:921 length:729 start_codon:yes stop_codon:yes gene_type:complete
MLEIEKFNKIVIANWKLNGSTSFLRDYLNNIEIKQSNLRDNCLIICPPTPYIKEINSSEFLKGAQDCSQFEEGAFTGEINAKMLKDIGCDFCIIGHSERRNHFKESNETILTKITNCINNDLIPICCVGESLEEKKQGLTKEVLKDQITKSLPKNINLNKIIIAYEPLWSIGTGIIPKIEDIVSIHNYIKNSIFLENNTKIVYGGSVKANNCKKIINLKEVDGLLVGGASLNLDEFNKIIEF